MNYVLASSPGVITRILTHSDLRQPPEERQGWPLCGYKKDSFYEREAGASCRKLFPLTKVKTFELQEVE